MGGLSSRWCKKYLNYLDGEWYVNWHSLNKFNFLTLVTIAVMLGSEISGKPVYKIT